MRGAGAALAAQQPAAAGRAGATLIHSSLTGGSGQLHRQHSRDLLLLLQLAAPQQHPAAAWCCHKRPHQSRIHSNRCNAAVACTCCSSWLHVMPSLLRQMHCCCLCRHLFKTVAWTDDCQLAAVDVLCLTRQVHCWQHCCRPAPDVPHCCTLNCPVTGLFCSPCGVSAGRELAATRAPLVSAATT